MDILTMAPYALLILFGAALVVAAFNAKHLIRWENRALTSLADAVRDYREGLEEEQRLLHQTPAQAQTVAPAQAARGNDIDIWAA